MRYMIFLENRTYTTEHGEPSTLAGHLEYLRQYGGTPDAFDLYGNLNEAKRAALNSGEAAIIVDEQAEYRPVFRHRPAEEKDPAAAARDIVTLAASEEIPDAAVELIQSRMGVTTGDVAGAVMSELDNPDADWADMDHLAREDLLNRYIEAELAHAAPDTPSP